MSRARDMANLGSQAGSGLDASDITTGTLGNTVQDNITRLGTVTTGTMKNTIHSDATFPQAHILKIERSEQSSKVTSNSTTTWNSILTDSITISANNKVLIIIGIPCAVNTDGSPGEIKIEQTGTASATVLSDVSVFDEHHSSGGGFFGGTFITGALSGAGSYTFTVYGRLESQASSGVVYWASSEPGGGTNSIATMVLMEIAQ